MVRKNGEFVLKVGVVLKDFFWKAWKK